MAGKSANALANAAFLSSLKPDALAGLEVLRRIWGKRRESLALVAENITRSDLMGRAQLDYEGESVAIALRIYKIWKTILQAKMISSANGGAVNGLKELAEQHVKILSYIGKNMAASGTGPGLYKTNLGLHLSKKLYGMVGSAESLSKTVGKRLQRQSLKRRLGKKPGVGKRRLDERKNVFVRRRK
jgi:hypothetical protein